MPRPIVLASILPFVVAASSCSPSGTRGVGTTAVVFNVHSVAAAPQPPLPRQAEIRVTDSADAVVGSHIYAQQ